MVIARINAEQTEALLPDLAALLQDAIDGGAALGFLPPLTREQALAYWREVAAAVRGGQRILLVARDDTMVAGSAQLDLATRPNGRHRAEVAKVMVHSARRRLGIGRALMQAVEAEARQAGRTTLVLDTRQGDPAEQLYQTCGYTVAGTIPEYARSGDGSLHTTVVMYKLLGERP